MTAPDPLPQARPGFWPRMQAFALKWRNASYSTFDHAWMILLWAISTPVFIRTLGEDAFGIWVLISTLVGLGGVVSFGFGEATVRYVSKYATEEMPDRVRQVIEASLTLYAATGLIFAAAIWALAPWLATRAFTLSPELQVETIWAFRIAAYVIFINAFMRTLESAINGFQRFDITARVSMIVRSAVLLVNLVLALAGWSLIALVAMTALGATVHTLINNALLRRRFVPRFRMLGRPDPATTREMFRFGVQIWLQMLGGAMSNSIDRFLVGSLVSPAAAGVYGVCLQLAQQIHLLLTRGLGFLMPAAAELQSRGAAHGDYRALYRSAWNLTLLIVGATALPLLVTASQLLTFWVGADFAAQGTQTMRGLTVVFAVMAPVVTPFLMLNGVGHPRWNTVLMLLNGVAVIVLAAILLPRFGLMGVVYARFLALPLQMAVFAGFHRHVLPRQGWGITLFHWGWMAVLLALGLAGAPVVDRWDQLAPAALIALCVGLAALGLALAALPMLVQRFSGTALR